VRSSTGKKSSPATAPVRSGFRAKTAHKIDDKADQQNQANPSSTDGGPAKVKAAAAEQQEKYNDKK
jgi:hypothetical protein